MTCDVVSPVTGRNRVRLLLMAATAVAWAASLAQGADESVDRLRAQCEAGEFAPAIAASVRLPAVDRDAALKEIAAAQAAAGAVRAASATAVEIRDDDIRRDVLAQLYPPSSGDAAEPRLGSVGAAGGGVQPDFEALMDLVSSTIAPDTWREAGGTQGEMKQHDGGVYVDAHGAMRPIVDPQESARLGTLRREAARGGEFRSARRSSPLRKISLTRLERELEVRRAQGRAVDEELQTLAGLERVRYIFVYPETGDVVLAGPAGDWYLGRENRLLSVEHDRPVVLLDDLTTLLRREFGGGDVFGCSIDPTPAGLENVARFATESAKRPLPPGGRVKWTEELGVRLGMQQITVHGIDPTSRAARVLVEADYRMKLVGIGREEGTLDVPSYFDIVRSSRRTQHPTMSLLRWWFTVNYDALLTSAKHDVYELRGQGVKLLSENEFLADRGRRVATGDSDESNREFADRFTKHFDALAQKYPIYAELRNLIDLALVASVLRNDAVCDRVGWRATGFCDPQIVAVERGPIPRQVDSVVASRELSPTLVMAAVSGGVTVDVGSASDPGTYEVDGRGGLAKIRASNAVPDDLRPRSWWWD